MTKLRRTNRESTLFPVAADVLEVRSLLSAGAHAAVAAAIHAQHHDAHPAAAPKPINLKGSVFSDFVHSSELGLTGFLGNLQFQSLSVVPVVGGKIHASWTQTGHFGGSGFTITSIKGNISAHVTSIDSGPTDTGFNFTPAGSLTIKGKFNGHAFTAKLTPELGDAAALQVTQTNSFLTLYEDFRLPDQGPTHGSLVSVTLDPPVVAP